MDRKKTLVTTTLLLFVLDLLTVNLVGVFSVPESPYIMVLPETTLDPNLTPGMDYEVSVYTDYAGSDVWCWQFSLAFDPTILEGIQVRNGDLITQEKIPEAWFVFAPGTFDNTAGTLSLTSAYYDFQEPYYNTTYGPGTLAYVTFRVKSYGFSYVTFDVTPSIDTVLVVAAGRKTDTKISGYEMPEQIGSGYFRNGLTGDANLDKTVNVFDILAVKSRWGRTPASPEWIREYDVNDDQAINVFDILTVKANWGQTAP